MTMKPLQNIKEGNDMTAFYRAVLFLVMATFIFSCHTNNDNLIIAGKRMGDCVLLKTRSKGADSANDLLCGMYRGSAGAMNGLDFYFDPHSGFLIGVGTTDSRYQTKNGIHVGDVMSKVLNAEGQGTPVVYIYHYYKKQPVSNKAVLALGHGRALRYPGIIFALNKQDRVGGIWIGTEENLSAMSCPVDPSTYSLLPSSRAECSSKE